MKNSEPMANSKSFFRIPLPHSVVTFRSSRLGDFNGESVLLAALTGIELEFDVHLPRANVWQLERITSLTV